MKTYKVTLRQVVEGSFYVDAESIEGAEQAARSEGDTYLSCYSGIQSPDEFEIVDVEELDDVRN